MLDIICSYALKLDIPQMTIVGSKKAPLTKDSNAKIDKQATLKAGRLRKFETSAGAVGKAQKTLRSATATKEQRDRAKATIKRAAEKMRSGGSGISFEKLHPRYPKGSPGGKGGKFMPKGSAEYKATVANNLAVEVASGKASLNQAREAAKEAGITTKPELGEELGAMFKEADRIGKKYQDEPAKETMAEASVKGKPAKKAKKAATEAATKPKPTNAKQAKETAAEALPPEPERMQTDLFGAATPVPKAPKNASNKRFSPEMLEYANKVLDDARQKVMKHDKLVEQWQPSKRAKALKETTDKLNRFQTMNSSQLEYQLSRDPEMKKYFKRNPPTLTGEGKAKLEKGLETIKQPDLDSAVDAIIEYDKLEASGKQTPDSRKKAYDAATLLYKASEVNTFATVAGQKPPFAIPADRERSVNDIVKYSGNAFIRPATYERTPHFDKVLKATRNKLANLPKSETEPPDFQGKITVDLTKFGGAKYEVEPTITAKDVRGKTIPGGIPQFQEWLNKDKTIKYDFGKPSAPTMPKGNPKEWKEALEGGDIDKATYDLLMNTQPKAPKKQTATKEASPQKPKKPSQSKMSKKESPATTTTKEIKFANVKEIGAHDPTPLGKIKVYADSDLNFFRKTPRKIVWEKDGNVTTAYLPVNEAKSTQPNYKMSMNGGETRSVPVFQVLKSLDANPPKEIVKFDLADFVKPKG